MVREIQVAAGDVSPGKVVTAQGRKSAPAAGPARAAKQRRVAVFIDGSNLYFKLRSLIPHKTDFIHYRYRDLALSLLAPGEKLVYVGYYVGVVRDTKRTADHDKTRELVQNQQKLFEQLRHQQIEVVKGYLLERDGKYFEKGVDVRLAVDIIGMAYGRKYDTAIIISSDTDLIPAMQAAQGRRRHVVYVGFEHQPSLALIRYADQTRLLTLRQAEHFALRPLAVNRYDDGGQERGGL